MADIYDLSAASLTLHPWPVLLEVVDATPPGAWVLAGGLMVHLHAMRGRVTMSRPTRDVPGAGQSESASGIRHPASDSPLTMSHFLL